MARWSLNNAWKLAALTAVVTFVGVFVALSLSLLLRPIPSYFFPLMSDVSKYQPEAFILRLAVIVTTALFFATTTATVLHCHTLQLFSIDRPNNTNPLPQQHQHILSFHHHAHTDSGVDINVDDLDLSEIVPVSPVTRRRNARFTTTRIFTLLVLVSIVSFATIQFDLFQPILGYFTAENLKWLLFNIAFYLIVIMWVLAMGFLIWYFLKLQNVPDWPKESSSTANNTSVSSNLDVHADLLPAKVDEILSTSPSAPSMTQYTTRKPPPHHHHHHHSQTSSQQFQNTDRDDDDISEQRTEQQSFLSQQEEGQAQEQQQQSSRPAKTFSDHLRAFASWLIAILRPICLTGQAVCIIKIFGLWLALDTFSISNIRLVKLALLATLAFVEYTAAFFFVFFMIILAIDMRAKAPSPEIIFQT